MHFLYIIYSESIDKYYIGESPDITNRLDQHNTHYFKKGFTKATNDWKIVLSMECKSKGNALYLEKFIKRMKSKKFTQKSSQILPYSRIFWTKDKKSLVPPKHRGWRHHNKTLG